MTLELDKYKNSPKAIDYIISLKQQVINNLSNIYNELSTHNTGPVVSEIEQTIGKLLVSDPNLNSFLIRVNLVENADKTGYINVNAYL